MSTFTKSTYPLMMRAR